MVNSPNKYRIGFLWLVVNFALVGFLCWGLYASYGGYLIETNGETTEGRIIDYLFMGHGIYSMYIEFDVSGQSYSFRDGRTYYNDEIGKVVLVRYNRSNPKYAKIDNSLFPFWLVPSCISTEILLGLILLNIRGWAVWKHIREFASSNLEFD